MTTVYSAGCKIRVFIRGLSTGGVWGVHPPPSPSGVQHPLEENSGIERLHSFPRDQLNKNHGGHVGVPDKRAYCT